MSAEYSLLEEERLWNNWITTKNNHAANELIQHYMYLVNFHVDRTASHLPRNVSRDDLVSFGLMGLFDALKKFEPARDLKFDTYASFRIRGAIIDGLRKEDRLSRTAREKVKKIEAITQILEQRLHRSPNMEEIANEIGMTIPEVETVMRDTLYASVVSIENKTMVEADQEMEGIGYVIPDDTAILPAEHLLQEETNENLIQAIKQLNRNEQLVVSLLYHEELTLTEIGKVMDLTTSRISQIHKTAISKLRKTLKSYM